MSRDPRVPDVRESVNREMRGLEREICIKKIRNKFGEFWFGRGVTYVNGMSACRSACIDKKTGEKKMKKNMRKKMKEKRNGKREKEEKRRGAFAPLLKK